MRSPCQLREPGHSHCQKAAKGSDASLPNSGPCWPLRTSWSRLVRGCGPPLWEPFLFKSDLKTSQSRGRVRRGRKGGACGDQSWEKRPPPSPPRAGRGHVLRRRATPSPLPLQHCCPFASQSHPEASRRRCSRGPLPSPHRRGTGWAGCLLTPGSGECPRAPDHLPQRLLGGAPWLAPP